MTDFMNMDDEGRREINRRVNARRQAGKPVSFSYAGPDGVPTSLATEQTVEEGIARIKPGDMLVLTPLLPLFLPSGEECLYIACEQDAGQTETLRLSAYIRRGDDYLRVFREMPGREAGLLFRDCFMRRASRTSPIGMCSHGKTIGPKSARSCSWTTSVSKTHPLRTWKPRSTAWTAAITARSS